MRVLKIIGVWMLLVVLTAAIVVVPPLWNEYQSTVQTETTVHWEYTGYIDTLISPAELAAMCCSGEIGMSGYTSFTQQEPSYDYVKVHYGVLEVLEAVFPNHPAVYESWQLAAGRIITYDRTVGLVMQNGKPIALSFVDVEYETNQNGGMLHIGFEEKTGTLLSIVYTQDAGYRYGYEVWEYEDMFMWELTAYFEKVLLLDSTQYLCECVTEYKDTIMMAQARLIQKDELSEGDFEEVDKYIQ